MFNLPRFYRGYGLILFGIMYYTGSTRGVEPDLPIEFAALQGRYLGVRYHHDPEAGTAVYGRTMTVAGSPLKAATGWITEYAQVLGVNRPELHLSRAHALGNGPATVFAYQQRIGGLPVEYGIARVLVQPVGRLSGVVFAAGHLVQPPAGGFGEIRVNEATAVALVRSMRRYGHLPEWSAPQLVVIEIENDRGAGVVRAWKVNGLQPRPEKYEAYTFFVDVATGRLVHVRNEVYQAAVAGTVRGFGSPGTAPDTSTNPPAPLPLPNLTVRDKVGAAIETGLDGGYTLEADGGTIRAALEGPFVIVRNAQGSDLLIDQAPAPSGSTDFVFNAVPDEFSTAQVNAFVHANIAHGFYTSYQPDFAELDRQLEALVNIPMTCNALFSPLGPSIQFFQAGGCVNTAYSTVITHEYGHFIVSQLGLRQQSFGEGFADSLAMLVYDDPVVGRDFLGPGTFVRVPGAAHKQYPCFGEIHDCGQVLGGIWWDLNVELQQSLGSEQGLEEVRQLFTDWSQITVGVRFGRNAATPLTAVEVLTVDDDDADLSNGTPHQDEICSAFAAHGIGCPNRCEAVTGLSLRCRRGTFRIQATVLAEDSQGSTFDLQLDSADGQTVTIGTLGRGTVRWSNVAAGDHQVCIETCGVCESVTCES